MFGRFRQKPYLSLAFLLAALLTVFFIIRTLVFAAYWADPAHQNQIIEPWMTIRYVSNSWGLPRREMIQALGFEPEKGRPLTFGQIAAQNDLSLADMTARIRAASQAFHATHP